MWAAETTRAGSDLYAGYVGSAGLMEAVESIFGEEFSNPLEILLFLLPLDLAHNFQNLYSIHDTVGDLNL